MTEYLKSCLKAKICPICGEDLNTIVDDYRSMDIGYACVNCSFVWPEDLSRQNVRQENESINVQKIKGLIKGWQNRSLSLKNEGKYDSAEIMDMCINEVMAFILFDEIKSYR